jgi:hypothetical protein
MFGQTRAGNFVLLLVALIVATATLGMSQPAAASGRSCTGWESRKVEPNYIRVLDTRTRKVHKVKFKRYVAQVMASGEWPGRLPYAALIAGAQAVKQFGWYYALKGNWRGGRSGGKCYDVDNTTNYQLWQHWAVPTPKQKRAVNAVWGLSLWKWNLRFFLTGYRTGYSRVCASDVNGWKLFERSVVACAKKGWSGKRILHRYFTKTAMRFVEPERVSLIE